MPDREAFIYVIRPARPGMLDKATKDEEETVQEHFRYLQGLHGEGRVVLAGPAPAAAATFGIVVFYAADEEEARTVMESDPAVARGVMKAELHPFRIAVGGAGA